VTLKGQNVAVFSWEGGKVRLEGQGVEDMAYTSSETPMPTYLNLHDALEARRRRAFAEGTAGPRVAVVGPVDAGKSTLCRILGSWAASSAWQPALVDLDVGQGAVTVPGTVSAVVLEAPVGPEEGLPVEAPLVYFFGAETPSDNPDLYRLCVERLAATLATRGDGDPRANAAGYVVNTMGWVEGLGYELLLHSIEKLGVDVVCVAGQDRLHVQLQRHFGARGGGVEVVQVPVSGGVVRRDAERRKGARVRRIHEYFYGPSGDLFPESRTVPLDSVEVYQVGNSTAALPQSALPIGAKAVSDPTKVSRATPFDLRNRVLAVTHAKDEGGVLESNVAGFVYVQDVVVQDGTPQGLTLLCPRPGPLPGKVLLAGRYKRFLD